MAMISALSRFVLAVALAGVLPSPVRGQTPEVPERRAAPEADEPESSSRGVVRILGGAATGLAIHEAGHVLVGTLVGADFDLRKVDFHGIPFFAVAHAPDLTGREDYAVSSAGLWTQYATSEWILTRNPRLRSERKPFQEGILAFHVGMALIYGVAGLAEIGPPERDTRAMARGLGVSERWIGASVLAPGLLDAYRYARPNARWAAWTSRGLKIALVGATLLGGGA